MSIGPDDLRPDNDDDDEPSEFVFPAEWAALEDADLTDEQTDELLKLLKQGSRRSPATVAVALVEEAGLALFHDESGACYGSFDADDHTETHPINSRPFKGWLRRLYYESRSTAISSTQLADAIGLLEAKATHDAPDPVEVHLRVARLGGDLFLDLGDPHWRVIHITRDGWRLTDRPPVRFRRSNAMAALHEPARCAAMEIAALSDHVNILEGDQYYLTVAWLVAALLPGAPFPILSLTGTAGSAKSTTAKMLRSLGDPSRSPLRAPSRDVTDLMVSATSGWICAYDNLSEISPTMSDALCRLSTGGGLGRRQLYTDSDEIVLDATRPVILTSIASAVTRGDLLSRSIILDLPRIPAKGRRDEEALWKAFENDRPKLLGALLELTAGVLARIDKIKLDSMPRMADFARVGVAVEQVLGWPAGSFLAAYLTNVSAGDVIAVEHSPIGAAIQAVAVDGGFEGKVGDLLERITRENPDAVTRGREWPKAPRGLTAELKRIGPNLAELGVIVEFSPTPRDGYRSICIRKAAA